jgi:hypothetical protein
MFKRLRETLELTLSKKKHLFDLLPTKPTKVKLAAIAKNESAYLPEWIFHHLFFGFDQIDIHINRTSDNTNNILKKVGELPNVALKNADAFFSTYKGNPQTGLYKKILKESKGSEFTHVCFLDIDEFWTPKDLSSTIHDCIKSVGKFDVMSFEWMNKVEPGNEFGPALSQQINVQRAQQIKSIIDVTCPVLRANPHTLVNPHFVYKASDGERLKHENNSFSKVSLSELDKPIKPFFIIHRYFRSEFEYVAMLGRGRPNFPEQGINGIKSNRKGYANSKDIEVVKFDEKSLSKYFEFMQKHFNSYIDPKESEIARNYVKESYNRTLNIIKNSEKKDEATIVKAFKNVNDPRALTAYNYFIEKISKT